MHKNTLGLFDINIRLEYKINETKLHNNSEQTLNFNTENTATNYKDNQL